MGLRDRRPDTRVPSGDTLALRGADVVVGVSEAASSSPDAWPWTQRKIGNFSDLTESQKTRLTLNCVDMPPMINATMA